MHVPMRMPPRIAFSTLAFPDATLASAASLGQSWGYSGIELRLTSILGAQNRLRSCPWVSQGPGKVI